MGHQLASTLGLSIRLDSISHDGGDATVYLLDDGKVLKITDSIEDAAISHALLGLDKDGLHPCVPRVDLVGRLEDWENAEDGVPATWYVIVREDFSDLDYYGPDEEEWEDLLQHLNSAWRNGNDARVAKMFHAAQKEAEDALCNIISGLGFLRETFGVTVLDIRASNVGISASGHAGMRDFGWAKIPSALLDAVADDRLPLLQLFPRTFPACS